jgi:uncharacterized damage-inducible protein DinB
VPVTKPVRAPEAILAELANFPDEFYRLILAGHGQEDYLRPARDGGWGVVEILPHLRDWEEIYLDRFQKLILEDRPHLPAYDDELWAIERDYRGQDPFETFEQFRQLRGQMIDLLEELSPEMWQRQGEHAAYGSITVQWLADHICDHDREHLRQAQDALA